MGVHLLECQQAAIASSGHHTPTYGSLLLPWKQVQSLFSYWSASSLPMRKDGVFRAVPNSALQVLLAAACCCPVGAVPRALWFGACMPHQGLLLGRPGVPTAQSSHAQHGPCASAAARAVPRRLVSQAGSGWSWIPAAGRRQGGGPVWRLERHRQRGRGAVPGECRQRCVWAKCCVLHMGGCTLRC